MAKQYTHIFTVEGKYNFPLDMIRYDRCFFYSESDSYAADGTIRSFPEERVQVTLTKDAPKSWVPTSGRWESFLWKVVSHKVRQY